MNRYPIIFILLLALVATTAQAAESFYLPDYYQQSGFLAMSPSSGGGASGGFFNPAIYGIGDGADMEFFWNDMTMEDDAKESWALAIDLGGLGFGMQEHKFYNPNDLTQEYKFNDYHLGLGFGDRANRFGIGYSWSKGDLVEEYPRDDVLSIGSLNRPCRYASVGVAGHWAMNQDDYRGVADIGIRPFGTSVLTLFGDASMMSTDQFKDVRWAAGASVEPISGVSLYGKAFYEGAYQAGISFSVAGIRAAFSPHFDKKGETVYNSYSVSLGQPTRNWLADKSMKDKTYLKMDFSNTIKYQRYKFFDRGGYTLMELLDLLEEVRKDPKVAGLAITIDERMYGSWELIWEVREKMVQLQKEGKKIVVFLERGGMQQYYLASVADRIMVDPVTTVSLMGFAMGSTYYKNMLDKVGIGVDEWRFFKYKSAMESISRTSMSDADREQRKALIDGFYEIMREDICASRPNLSHADFDHIVNNVSMMDTDSLMHYGLVDTFGRGNDMEELIKSVEDGKGKMQMDINAYRALIPKYFEWGEPDRIAVIYGLGPCAMDYGLNARKLGGVIEAARNDKHVKAIVFRADSPGGDILPSDIVAEELKKTAEEKPVIVTQGFVAGSGGYWISMYGDRILASPWTITGSIGVIGGWLYNDGLGDKIGLDFDYTKSNEHADLGRGIAIPFLGTIPDRPLTDDERARMQANILNWYDDFVAKVADGRGMTKEAVHEVAQGRVWTGTAGLEIGLIDEIGGLEDAINIAREEAGLTSRYVEITEGPDRGLFNPRALAGVTLGVHTGHIERFESSPDVQYIRMLMDAQGAPLLMVPPEFIIQ